MYEYIFLFGLALVWSLFAGIQDLKSTEISDWLTFSLLLIALGYRGIFAIANDRPDFFIFGVIGTLIFMALAYGLYYGHFFAGGDAKLLMSFGAILPFEKISDYALYGGGFLLVLLVIGAIYSLIYSTFLVYGNFERFNKGFRNNIFRFKLFIYGFVVIVVILFFVNYLLSFIWLIVGILFLYLKTVEEACMIKKIRPGGFTRG